MPPSYVPAVEALCFHLLCPVVRLSRSHISSLRWQIHYTEAAEAASNNCDSLVL